MTPRKPYKAARKLWTTIRIDNELYKKLKADKERTSVGVSKRFAKLYEDQDRLDKMEKFLQRIANYELIWVNPDGTPMKATVKNVVDKLLNEPKT